MTSPSAQKAAGETAEKLLVLAAEKLVGERSLPVERYGQFKQAATPVIQQAITEAVDAAVAPKEKRVKELEAALQGAVNLCERLVVAYSKLADANSAVATVTIAVGSVLTTAHELPEARKLLEAPHEP